MANTKKKALNYPVKKGQPLWKAAREAVTMAKKTGQAVSFQFNEVSMRVPSGGAPAEWLVQTYFEVGGTKPYATKNTP